MLKNLIPESKKLYDVTIGQLLDEFLKFNEKTLIMFDLETLGLNPKYEYEQITEVAAWAVAPSEFEILEKMNILIIRSIKYLPITLYRYERNMK